MLKPTKILVPTDFSKDADNALKEALGIALEYGAEVHILHIAEEKIRSIHDDYSDISISPDTIKRQQKKILRQAKMKLDKQIDRLSPSTDIKIIREVEIGIPYEEIIRFQTENGIDLVVISSLGKTGISKYFIGGVARNVLKGSTCSVLLMKRNGVG
jgi:universal stress protein A